MERGEDQEVVRVRLERERERERRGEVEVEEGLFWDQCGMSVYRERERERYQPHMQWNTAEIH